MPMDNLFDLADAVIYVLPMLAMAGFLAFLSTRLLHAAH
jgi:hypothetical protein